MSGVLRLSTCTLLCTLLLHCTPAMAPDMASRPRRMAARAAGRHAEPGAPGICVQCSMRLRLCATALTGHVATRTAGRPCRARRAARVHGVRG